MKIYCHKKKKMELSHRLAVNIVNVYANGHLFEGKKYKTFSWVPLSQSEHFSIDILRIMKIYVYIVRTME